MTDQTARKVGVPGALTRSQYFLVFSVPVLAIVALVVGVVIQGRVDQQRKEDRANAAVEAFLAETLATEGRRALAEDQNRAWICSAARARASGEHAAVEEYDKISRDLAQRFVNELC
jgi:hypothetical protein